MCGIAGAVSLGGKEISYLDARLQRMSELLVHRGPDGHGTWMRENQSVGFAHRRLSVVDLSENAAQPMISPSKSVVTYNGEIYNHYFLRNRLEAGWNFRSRSDTEVLLAAYLSKGKDCLESFSGMFAFAIWNEPKKEFFAARDRLGIKPFYYLVSEDILYFASEIKALVPFLNKIQTDYKSLEEYLAFQHTLTNRTLFEGIFELPPGHMMTLRDGQLMIEKYWEIPTAEGSSRDEYELLEEIRHHTTRSVIEHLSGDVEVGAYVSGGIDSSLIFLLANETDPRVKKTFHGRFSDYPGFDESIYASLATRPTGSKPSVLDITAEDFEKSMSDIIYHLDTPMAGPGSFPQYMISEFASRSVKVVLGGQGGDEIFAGYSRYLVAYLELCLLAQIDGENAKPQSELNLKSILKNLHSLQEYKPLLQKFWSKGLFGPFEERYFALLDRSLDFTGIISSEVVNRERLYASFLSAFQSPGPSATSTHLDSMLRFDLQNSLPALLHVEDRMSMAHGIESRVPILDHELVELATKVPAAVKFRAGETKYLLKKAFEHLLPPEISGRRDKMGFPVPLAEWSNNELGEFLHDTFSSAKAKSRDYLVRVPNPQSSLPELSFSRRTWVLLSLELWHQAFHDVGAKWRFSG